MKQQEQRPSRQRATPTASSASRTTSPLTSGAWIETDNKKPAAVRRYPYIEKMILPALCRQTNNASRPRRRFLQPVTFLQSSTFLFRINFVTLHPERQWDGKESRTSNSRRIKLYENRHYIFAADWALYPPQSCTSRSTHRPKAQSPNKCVG